MDLILWRHAEAEDGAPDDARKLTPKGVKQAGRIAQWLAPRLPEKYRLLASPAERAQQTARALDKKFSVVGEIGTSTSAKALLAATGWPKGEGLVIVVGHMPTLGEAASLLLSGREAPWNIRKGAIWWFGEKQGEVTLRAVISPDMA